MYIRLFLFSKERQESADWARRLLQLATIKKMNTFIKSYHIVILFCLITFPVFAFLAKHANHNGVIAMETDLDNEVFLNGRADRGIEEHFHELSLRSGDPMRFERVNFIVFIKQILLIP